jgi:rhodanese-related sulfurtransferase
MNRFLEYTTNHPFLVAAAVILLALAVVIEIRQRGRGASAIAPNDAVRSVPAGELSARADGLKKFKEKPVIVYCESGFASAAAARGLRALGFSKVVTLRGGLQSWRQENLPVVKGTAKKNGKQT